MSGNVLRVVEVRTDWMTRVVLTVLSLPLQQFDGEDGI